MNADEQMMAAVLASYQDAVNRSDSDAVVPLYAPDGVLMAQNSKPSVGADAVRAAYGAMFGAIKLDIAFEIDEVRQLAPDWGFARTHSNGTIGIVANGQAVPEANQELFLFQKVGGAWKIARYSFSTVLPAQA